MNVIIRIALQLTFLHTLNFEHYNIARDCILNASLLDRY